MKRRKFLLGSSALLASGGFLTSAGAFSSTTAERAVKIEVVGDENAYLGLREAEMSDGEMLFETDMPRTAPETFDITNQTAGRVDMEIVLLDGDLEFTDAVPGSGVESTTVEADTLTITGIDPGAQVTDVTIGLPAGSSGVITDTLSFDVTGDDGALQIDAERTLALEEMDATIEFDGAITATFEIPEIENVDPNSVTVNGYVTEQLGEEKFKLKHPENIDCEPGETITVTVRGKTTDGVHFSGTASDVNCSNGGSEDQQGGREDE